MLNVVLLVGLFWLTVALGHRVHRWGHTEFQSDPEHLCFAAGTGLAILIVGALALGSFGLLPKPGIAGGLCALLAILLRRDLGLALRLVRRTAVAITPQKGSRLLAAITAVALVACLAGARSPETGWDALAYHLTVPQIFIDQGRICPIPNISHATNPLNGEILFTLAMTLSDDALARLLNVLTGALVLLTIWSLLYRYCSAFEGHVAVAIFATVPGFLTNAVTANTDLALALFVCLSFYAVVNWISADDRGLLMFGAIYAGLAAGTKYTGPLAIVFLVLGGLIKFLSTARVNGAQSVTRAAGGSGLVEGRRRVSGSAASFLRAMWAPVLVASIVAAPWYVRNAVCTGNPVFPYLGKLFRSKQATAVQSAIKMTSFGGRTRNLASLIRFPWDLTMGTQRFDQDFVDSTGPVFLCILPLMIPMLLRPRRLPIFVTLGYACLAVAGLFMFVFLPKPRYSLPFLPLGSALCAYGYRRLTASDVRIRRWAFRALVCVLLSLLAVGLARTAPRARAALGLQSAHEFLLQRDDSYPMAHHLRANADKLRIGRLLIIADRCYYFYRLGVPCLAAHPEKQMVIDYGALRSAKELLARLRELRVTHVVFDTQVKGRLVNRAQIESLLASLFENHCRFLHEVKCMALYEVRHP